MFEPRELIPLAIELCNAPMAVMTEITENTPIVMPVMVRAERSLFAPSDANAMAMVSLKGIWPNQKSEYRSSKQIRMPKLGNVRDHGPSDFRTIAPKMFI